MCLHGLSALGIFSGTCPDEEVCMKAEGVTTQTQFFCFLAHSQMHFINWTSRAKGHRSQKLGRNGSLTSEQWYGAAAPHSKTYPYTASSGRTGNEGDCPEERQEQTCEHSRMNKRKKGRDVGKEEGRKGEGSKQASKERRKGREERGGREEDKSRRRRRRRREKEEKRRSGRKKSKKGKRRRRGLLLVSTD